MLGASPPDASGRGDQQLPVIPAFARTPSNARRTSSFRVQHVLVSSGDGGDLINKDNGSNSRSNTLFSSGSFANFQRIGGSGVGAPLDGIVGGGVGTPHINTASGRPLHRDASNPSMSMSNSQSQRGGGGGASHRLTVGAVNSNGQQQALPRVLSYLVGFKDAINSIQHGDTDAEEILPKSSRRAADEAAARRISANANAIIIKQQQQQQQNHRHRRHRRSRGGSQQQQQQQLASGSTNTTATAATNPSASTHGNHHDHHGGGDPLLESDGSTSSEGSGSGSGSAAMLGDFGWRDYEAAYNDEGIFGARLLSFRTAGGGGSLPMDATAALVPMNPKDFTDLLEVSIAARRRQFDEENQNAIAKDREAQLLRYRQRRANYWAHQAVIEERSRPVAPTQEQISAAVKEQRSRESRNLIDIRRREMEDKQLLTMPMLDRIALCMTRPQVPMSQEEIDSYNSKKYAERERKKEKEEGVTGDAVNKSGLYRAPLGESNRRAREDGERRRRELEEEEEEAAEIQKSRRGGYARLLEIDLDEDLDDGDDGAGDGGNDGSRRRRRSTKLRSLSHEAPPAMDDFTSSSPHRRNKNKGDGGGGEDHSRKLGKVKMRDADEAYQKYEAHMTADDLKRQMAALGYTPPVQPLLTSRSSPLLAAKQQHGTTHSSTYSSGNHNHSPSVNVSMTTNKSAGSLGNHLPSPHQQHRQSHQHPLSLSLLRTNSSSRLNSTANTPRRGGGDGGGGCDGDGFATPHRTILGNAGTLSSSTSPLLHHRGSADSSALAGTRRRSDAMNTSTATSHNGGVVGGVDALKAFLEQRKHDKEAYLEEHRTLFGHNGTTKTKMNEGSSPSPSSSPSAAAATDASSPFSYASGGDDEGDYLGLGLTKRTYMRMSPYARKQLRETAHAVGAQRAARLEADELQAQLSMLPVLMPDGTIQMQSTRGPSRRAAGEVNLDALKAHVQQSIGILPPTFSASNPTVQQQEQSAPSPSSIRRGTLPPIAMSPSKTTTSAAATASSPSPNGQRKASASGVGVGISEFMMNSLSPIQQGANNNNKPKSASKYDARLVHYKKGVTDVTVSMGGGNRSPLKGDASVAGSLAEKGIAGGDDDANGDAFEGTVLTLELPSIELAANARPRSGLPTASQFESYTSSITDRHAQVLAVGGNASSVPRDRIGGSGMGGGITDHGNLARASPPPAAGIASSSIPRSLAPLLSASSSPPAKLTKRQQHDLKMLQLKQQQEAQLRNFNKKKERAMRMCDPSEDFLSNESDRAFLWSFELQQIHEEAVTNVFETHYNNHSSQVGEVSSLGTSTTTAVGGGVGTATGGSGSSRGMTSRTVSLQPHTARGSTSSTLVAASPHHHQRGGPISGAALHGGDVFTINVTGVDDQDEHLHDIDVASSSNGTATATPASSAQTRSPAYYNLDLGNMRGGGGGSDNTTTDSLAASPQNGVLSPASDPFGLNGSLGGSGGADDGVTVNIPSSGRIVLPKINQRHQETAAEALRRKLHALVLEQHMADQQRAEELKAMEASSTLARDRMGRVLGTVLASSKLGMMGGGGTMAMGGKHASGKLNRISSKTGAESPGSGGVGFGIGGRTASMMSDESGARRADSKGDFRHHGSGVVYRRRLYGAGRYGEWTEVPFISAHASFADEMELARTSEESTNIPAQDLHLYSLYCWFNKTTIIIRPVSQSAVNIYAGTAMVSKALCDHEGTPIPRDDLDWDTIAGLTTYECRVKGKSISVSLKSSPYPPIDGLIPVNPALGKAYLDAMKRARELDDLILSANVNVLTLQLMRKREAQKAQAQSATAAFIRDIHVSLAESNRKCTETLEAYKAEVITTTDKESVSKKYIDNLNNAQFLGTKKALWRGLEIYYNDLGIGGVERVSDEGAPCFYIKKAGRYYLYIEKTFDMAPHPVPTATERFLRPVEVVSHRQFFVSPVTKRIEEDPDSFLIGPDFDGLCYGKNIHYANTSSRSSGRRSAYGTADHIKFAEERTHVRLQVGMGLINPVDYDHIRDMRELTGWKQNHGYECHNTVKSQVMTSGPYVVITPTNTRVLNSFEEVIGYYRWAWLDGTPLLLSPNWRVALRNGLPCPIGEEVSTPVVDDCGSQQLELELETKVDRGSVPSTMTLDTLKAAYTPMQDRLAKQLKSQAANGVHKAVKATGHSDVAYLHDEYTLMRDKKEVAGAFYNLRRWQLLPPLFRYDEEAAALGATAATAAAGGATIATSNSPLAGPVGIGCAAGMSPKNFMFTAVAGSGKHPQLLKKGKKGRSGRGRNGASSSNSLVHSTHLQSSRSMTMGASGEDDDLLAEDDDDGGVGDGEDGGVDGGLGGIGGMELTIQSSEEAREDYVTDEGFEAYRLQQMDIYTRAFLELADLFEALHPPSSNHESFILHLKSYVWPDYEDLPNLNSTTFTSNADLL